MKIPSSSTTQAAYLRIDERNHVEKPFLDQLAGLGWEVLDLDSKQHPGDSFRESFTAVVMLPVLRERLKVINPWLEDDQVDPNPPPTFSKSRGNGSLLTIFFHLAAQI